MAIKDKRKGLKGKAMPVKKKKWQRQIYNKNKNGAFESVKNTFSGSCVVA